MKMKTQQLEKEEMKNPRVNRRKEIKKIRAEINEKETKDTVRDFIFLSSKITADGDCSHEIKRHLEEKL